MSKDFLQSHVGPESPLVLGFNPLTDSPWLPRKWRVTINHIIDRRDVAPESSGQPGGSTVYKWPKIAEKVTKIQVMTTHAALAQTGGTYVCFEDFAGFDEIDHVDISYAGNPLQTIYGLQMYIWHRLHKRQDKQDAEAVLVGGNMTQAERITAAASAQKFYVDIPAFFTYETHSSFPLLVLAEEIRFEVFYKQLSQVVNSDASLGNVTGGAITTQALRISFVQNIKSEKNIINSAVNEGNGIIFPILDVERQPLNLLQSGNTSFNVKITNAKAPCSYFSFVARKNSKINSTTYGNTFNQFETVSNWDLMANSDYLIRNVEHDYNLFYLNPLYYEGPPRDNIYGSSFSLVPENRYDCNGSNYFAMQNNPTLDVTMPSALGENYYLDAFFFVENFIQIKGPDVIKIFK